MLWRLLTGPEGAVVAQIGLADGNLAHITRTVRWIRDHHDDTIRIEQLASLAGMSESTFHRHFRAVTRMTPIQYQKAVRLQDAGTRSASARPTACPRHKPGPPGHITGQCGRSASRNCTPEH